MRLKTALIVKQIIKSLFIALLTAGMLVCLPVSPEASTNQISKTDFWGTKWKEKSWTKRLSPAPPELLEYLQKQNKLDGFSEVPLAQAPSQKIARACKDISHSLSPALNKLLNERLIGIFCVKDLGSSGFAEEIIDEADHHSYAVIVLDREVLLKRKANEWASWKENSVFQPQKDGFKLHLTIESKKNNNVQNAVRYLLLHELGHVLGLVSGAHPSWSPSGKAIVADYDFMNLSWQNHHENPVSLFDKSFPERKKIRYYSFGKAQLTNKQIPVVYRKLQQTTNFVSLQGAANVWEDFAESFVTYVHVLIDKKIWQVRIENHEGKSTVINSCWKEERCTEKKQFMAHWFVRPL